MTTTTTTNTIYSYVLLLYEVRLCIAGEWRGVTVDDYVPCMPGQRGRPAFTRNAAAGELTCDGWMSYNPAWP